MTREEIVRASRDEDGGMYIVIPSVVQLDAELPLSARMLYGIITWKCNKRAYTWASNRELGKALGVSGKRVSELLSLLEKRGHVETEIEYKPGTKEVARRYIYPIMKSSRGVLRADPPPKNRDTPPAECGYRPLGIGGPPPENKEVIGNIKKENKNSPPYSPPEGDGAPGEDDGAAKLSPQGEAGEGSPCRRADKPGLKSKRGKKRFVPPGIDEVRAYCLERKNGIDPEAFVAFYASKGWQVGRSPMRDWKAAVHTWERRRAGDGKGADSHDDWY